MARLRQLGFQRRDQGAVGGDLGHAGRQARPRRGPGGLGLAGDLEGLFAVGDDRAGGLQLGAQRRDADRLHGHIAGQGQIGRVGAAGHAHRRARHRIIGGRQRAD